MKIDLFGEPARLALPPRYTVEGKILDNPIRQIAHHGGGSDLHLSPFSTDRVAGYVAVDSEGDRTTIISRKTAVNLGPDPILLVPDATDVETIRLRLSEKRGRWLGPKPTEPQTFTLPEADQHCETIVSSWNGRFQLRDEIRQGDEIIQTGLRTPQVGAIHATLAHWSVSEKPATIVMPTGTGKTETMLALLTATRIRRLMVVVPNIELRDQIVGKFMTLGVLKAAGCLAREAQLPVVATLVHRPKTPEEVDEIFLRANVVVAIINIAGQCVPEVQARMAELTSHLFIDEAHHVAARTWTAFKAHFSKSRIIQFTATPFRTDGRRVDGKFIYVYPLAKAQAEGYFKPIRFEPVQGLDQSDTDDAIIAKVGIRLDEDLRGGFDHLVMARVEGIERAKALHAKYATRLPRWRPVLVHSKMSPGEKRMALERLWSRESRIVVCVNMLGEGFDLPELKIAALHDRHKSIAITLQFTGRFTRTKGRLGDARVIANIAQDDVEGALRSLYAEDADWNFLLTVLSGSRTDRQVKRAEILEGFVEKLEDIPLQVLTPKMSAVVYRTECDRWDPFAVEQVIPPANIHAGPIVNEAKRLALFITRDEEAVRWGEVRQVINTEWNLYLLHWDEEQNLLFINSSKAKELHEHVATAVCGEPVTRILGETIFRSLDGFNRLVLMNLGLSHALGRYIRYTMFMGSDITEQLTPASLGTKRKSNLFGRGFANGEKATIGCSAKGRIWSHQIAHDFSEWIDWCHENGRKLLNDSITTDRILENIIKPKVISCRPDKPPIAIHWPEGFLEQLEDRVEFNFGGEVVGFHDCEIEFVNHDDEGPLLFQIVGNDCSATFEVCIDEREAIYPQRCGAEVSARIGSKIKPLSDWFKEDPPQIHFADGDFLIFNELFVLPKDRDRVPFDVAKMDVIDWEGVNKRKESQGPTKDPTSVQRRVIEYLDVQGDYDVIFDDDGSGEVADIVTIKLVGSKVQVELYHCKYSMKATSGGRVKDLFEVCGQAQKSVRWRESPWRMLKRLLKREKDRTKARKPSRFEKGGAAWVGSLVNRWRDFQYDYRVFIVQPGVSKTGATQQQLDILAATETYLLDTYAIPLRVIVDH